MKLSRNRNLFNADCSTIFAYAPKLWQPEGGPFSARAPRRFVQVMAESSVDTLVINPNCQVPWYPSKVLPTAWTGYKRGDRNFFRSDVANDPDFKGVEARIDEGMKTLNLYLDLEEAGVDWVAEMIASCRGHRITPWSSVRMNDTHGAAAPDSYMNCALFREPRYRTTGNAPNPADGPYVWFIGLNYALPEVREYMMKMIRELIEDYDFEGMELDWLRHLPIFDMPATQQNIDTITEWIAEIRQLTEARSARTGKPYPLGMRVPADLNKARSFGIDVRELARRDLIDFIIAANFWQTNWDTPHDQLRAELGDRVTIYGATESVANWLEIPSATVTGTDNKPMRQWRWMAASAELLRGNAAGKLALGAHGVEQYNFFCTDAYIPHMQGDYPALRGLTDLKGLRGQSKHYTLSNTPPVWWMPPHIEAADQLPALIEFDSRRAFRIPMARESLSKGLALKLQIVLEKQENVPQLGVSFNGSWPTFDGEPTDQLFFPIGSLNRYGEEFRAFNFRLDPATIKEGWNEIVIYCGQHKPLATRNRAETMRVVSIELAVQRS
jgi:hypothetical protein